MAKTKTKEKYFLKEDIRDFIFEKEEGMYDARIEEIKYVILNDISKRKCKCLITLNDNNKDIEMSLGNYLTYLIIFLPFYVFDAEIEDDMIPDVKSLDSVEKYYDKIIRKFKFEREENETEEEQYEVGEILVEIQNNLNHISCELNKCYGPTIDLHSMIKLAERNPEFAHILYEPEDYEGSSAKEIVAHTNMITKKLEKIIIEDDKTNLKKFITSGAGINMKQLGQVFGFIGLKPDLKEKIIPKPISTNFCMGLNNISEFYINATGCLKALITSKIQTKNSGYFTRKLEILLNDEFIADVDDCGTKHLMPLKIKSEKYIKHINNRWYSLSPDGKNLKKFDDIEDNSNLIGKTIYLRDPSMCACKHGICKKCYGDLYRINQYMNIGIIACLLLTNAFTQNALSTKHLLQANVLKKNFSEAFSKYFELELDQVIIKEEYIDKIKLGFDADIDFDEDSENEYKIMSFSVIDGNNRIDINEDIYFVINPELNEYIKSNFDKEFERYIVKPKHFKDLDYVFSHSIENNGLSRPMLMTKELIERNTYIKELDIFEIYEKFIDLLVESNSYIDYVHIGVILKNLMEIEGTRESFKEVELPNINLYCVPDAIQYLSESVSKALIFERIKDQLLTDKYGTLEKDGYSNYDELM